MLAHLNAVKALLEPTGYTVYLIDAATTPTYPYVVLWSSAGMLVADTLDGIQDDLDELLGVTVAAATPEAVLTAVPLVRAALLDAQPVVAGRYVQPLRFFDAVDVSVDRQVTMPNTNRHPAFAVDKYRLISEPA